MGKHYPSTHEVVKSLSHELGRVAYEGVIVHGEVYPVKVDLLVLGNAQTWLACEPEPGELATLPKEDPFRCCAKSMKELDKVQARMTRAGLHDLARSVRDLRDEMMGYIEKMGREMDL